MMLINIYYIIMLLITVIKCYGTVELKKCIIVLFVR